VRTVQAGLTKYMLVWLIVAGWALLWVSMLHCLLLLHLSWGLYGSLPLMQLNRSKLPRQCCGATNIEHDWSIMWLETVCTSSCRRA